MYNKNDFPYEPNVYYGGCEHKCETCDSIVTHDTMWEDEDGKHSIKCDNYALCAPCRDREARHLWHLPNMNLSTPPNHPVQSKEMDDGEDWCNDNNCSWCDTYFEKDFGEYGCECSHCGFKKRYHKSY